MIFKCCVCVHAFLNRETEAVKGRFSFELIQTHDGVIKRKHFPLYWPFVQGIHRSPVNSPHKGQRRGALMLSLICAWINGCVNNHEAGDLGCHRAHYDVIVMNHTIIEDGTRHPAAIAGVTVLVPYHRITPLHEIKAIYFMNTDAYHNAYKTLRFDF